MSKRPVVMAPPLLDRFLLVLTELQVRLETSDKIKQSEICEVVDRWTLDSCPGWHLGEDCCDAARLHTLVWVAVQSVAVEEDLDLSD